MHSVAFQDSMSGNHCFGCGADNEDGLRIKSFWSSPAESVCRFRPKAHQAAGPRGYLNGGIIATVIDCHGVCTAIADAYRREGREIGEGELIWYVTGLLKVDYRRPTPIGEEVTIRARVADIAGRKTWVDCELSSGGKSCADGRLLAVRVNPTRLRHDGAGPEVAR